MKPYVKNQLTGEVLKTTVRRLYESDLDEIMRLQGAAAGTLEDASLYVPTTRDEFLVLLRRGEVQGMFADGTLCAAATILPAVLGDITANDAGFAQEQLAASATLECYFVSPVFRGNGIARELALVCIDRAAESFGARHLLATVSPKNLASLLSLMSINGFRIRSLRQKYGCKLRYVLCHTRNNPRLYTYYERFSASNVYDISRCLANGYEGISTFTESGTVYIWVAK